MNNKRNGTKFEKEFCRMLFDIGFWAHRLQDNHNGQPFDVIAARNGHTHVFDCKDCVGEYFPFSRIEENQVNAMQLWQDSGNTDGMFAIKFSIGVLLIKYNNIKVMMSTGMKGLSMLDVKRYGITFHEWVSKINEFDDKQ